MRIASRLFLLRWAVLGGVMLYFAPGDPARAGRFAIDPDPSSPTLGELLDREKRKAPAISAPPPAKAKDAAPDSLPPVPPVKPFVTTPHVPRNASTVVLPRPPARKIDMSAQTARASADVTHSINRATPASSAADIREHSLALGNVAYAELIRVLKAADFDAVRYPIRKTEKSDVIIVTAPTERAQRLAALIAVLGASRGDNAVLTAAPR